MFEATFNNGKLFKMIVESMKELVTIANLECSGSGISMQVKKKINPYITTIECYYVP